MGEVQEQGTNIKDGVFTSGPYAGQSVDDVMAYLSNLETAIAEGREVAARQVEKPKVKPDSRAALEQHASERVDPIMLLTWQRLEQEDEERFASSVPDYATYKEDIDKAKALMHPAQRVQTGLHRRLYLNFRVDKDPDAFTRLVGKAQKEEPSPEETDEEREAREAEEAKIEEAEKARLAKEKEDAEKKKASKPVPPSARPTPSNRSAVPPSKKADLKLPDSVRKYASAMGVSEEAYKERLSKTGIEQSEIDDAAMKREDRRVARGSVSIFDKVTR